MNKSQLRLLRRRKQQRIRRQKQKKKQQKKKKIRNDCSISDNSSIGCRWCDRCECWPCQYGCYDKCEEFTSDAEYE